MILKEGREGAKQLFGEQVPKLERAQLQMPGVGNLPSKSEEVQEASPLVPRKRLGERVMTQGHSGSHRLSEELWLVHSSPCSAFKFRIHCLH